MNRATRRYYGAACGSWRCGMCAPVKRRQAMRRVRLGLGERGRSRLLTLTSPPGERFAESAAASSRRFEHLRLIHLRATGHRLEYLAIAERGTRGERRYHLHALVRGGPYVDQARWSQWAERAGLGRVVDIRAVRDGELAAYATKSLAGYLTKSATDADWPRHARRMRVSRGWAPSWVVYKPRDPGAWAVVGFDREWVPGDFIDRLVRERDEWIM